MRNYLLTGFGIVEFMRPSLAIAVLSISCGAYLLVWLLKRYALPHTLHRDLR